MRARPALAPASLPETTRGTDQSSRPTQDFRTELSPGRVFVRIATRRPTCPLNVQPPGNCSNRSRYRSYHCFHPSPSSKLPAVCSSLVTRHLSLSRLRETSDIEGKAAREAASDSGQGASFNSCRKLLPQQPRRQKLNFRHAVLKEKKQLGSSGLRIPLVSGQHHSRCHALYASKALRKHHRESLVRLAAAA